MAALALASCIQTTHFRAITNGRLEIVSTATLLRLVPVVTSQAHAIPFFKQAGAHSFGHQDDSPEPESKKSDPLDSVKDVTEDVTTFIDAVWAVDADLVV